MIINRELKPCPFCGGTAESRKYESDFFCQCIQCFGSTCGDYQSEQESISAWNRRTQAAPEAEPVAWRDHSVNYAKGEKCPQTIETLQAAWDRDQELMLDQKTEISRLKEKINQLRQKLSVPPHDAELVELLRESKTWIDNNSCHGTDAIDLMSRIDAKLAALSVKA